MHLRRARRNRQPIRGTTRDTIDTTIERERPKTWKLLTPPEFARTSAAVSATAPNTSGITRSFQGGGTQAMSVLVIDASTAVPPRQDSAVAGRIEDKTKTPRLRGVVNKWDRIEKGQHTHAGDGRRSLRANLYFLDWGADAVHLALSGHG